MGWNKLDFSGFWFELSKSYVGLFLFAGFYASLTRVGEYKIG